MAHMVTVLSPTEHRCTGTSPGPVRLKAKALVPEGDGIEVESSIDAEQGTDSNLLK